MAVYDAKFGRPQMGGGGWSNADTCWAGGMKRGHFLRTSFMDDRLDVKNDNPEQYTLNTVIS